MSLTSVHPDYTLMQFELEKVRDAVSGAFFVKRKGLRYLAHPSDMDQTSEPALKRYQSYLQNAEFDDVPKFTMRSMLGRMSLAQSTVVLPTGLEYLKENVDNDGLSLLGQAENVAANILQVEWHLLLAESVNSPAAGQVFTPSELAALGNRAAIKSYSRESVVDWDFSKINGVNQLSYVKLRERKYKLNYNTGSRLEFDEYLILALDEQGNYIWWRETIPSGGGSTERTEPTTVFAGGLPLKWLPVEIVASVEPESGKLPLHLGFLSPIVDKVLHRYVDSANYAEGRMSLIPTTNTSGWKANDFDVFRECNGGRDYIVLGSKDNVNNLPEGVTMDILVANAALEHFVTYRNNNAQDIRALGGEFSGDETAGKSDTQSGNESSDKAAKMLSIVNNIEQAYKRLITYCGVLQGVYQQENIEQELNNIELSLNRSFAKAQRSVDEGRFIVTELRMSGLFNDERILSLLKAAGWNDFEIEDILNDRDSGQQFDAN
jgi:hypothetical protein